MKFLVTIDDSKQAAQAAFVNLDANQRWVEKNVGKKVEAIYSLAGGHGAVMIVDVASHEELDELIIGNAAMCHGTDLKIYPLADYRSAMKVLEGRFSKMASQLKSGS